MPQRRGPQVGRSLNRLLSSALCVGAGAYLLQTQAVGESSWFEAIAHGMGIYFIGKGVFIWGSLGLQGRTVDALEASATPDNHLGPD